MRFVRSCSGHLGPRAIVAAFWVMTLTACSGGATVSPSGGGGAGAGDEGGGGAAASGGSGGQGTGGAGGTGGGAPACSGLTDFQGTFPIELEVDGQARKADLHVPPIYDPTKPTMLVLNFHGYSSNSIQQQLLSGMSAEADLRNFIVAYPEGIGASWNAGACCGTAAMTGIDDVAFARALVAKLSEDYCIDPKRVYAAGMSNGGFFSHRLGCDAADVFAAIAPVAGMMVLPFEECAPSRPVPVMHFHGTADLVVAYDGNMALGFPSVGASTARWIELNGCEDTSEITYQNGDSTCETWKNCQGGSEVTLCTVEEGGHTWPGGPDIPSLGKTSHDLDATKAMLDMFKAHPMP